MTDPDFAMSFAWENPAAAKDDEPGYLWERKNSMSSYEQDLMELYRDSYHIHTGVPLEEGYIFPFDQRVVWNGDKYVLARSR